MIGVADVRLNRPEKLGLVTRLAADPLADALALARTISSASPDAFRAAKRLFNLSGEATDAAILRVESEEQERLLASANHAEARAAAAERRPPRFRDEDEGAALR